MKFNFITPVLLFLFIFGIALIIRAFLLAGLTEPLQDLLFKSTLLILFVGLPIFAGVLHRQLFRLTLSLSKTDFLLLLGVTILFTFNNYLFKENGTFEYGNWESRSFALSFIGISISSVGEEFMYRGYLQPKINQTASKQSGILSKGNSIASLIMLITHFGFFTIMPIFQAIPALLLVLTFSLSVGYLRDKHNTLLLPILFHLLINYLHLLIH